MSVIDLCSSDEDDDPSPRKSALESFAPRKEKGGGAGNNGDQTGRGTAISNGHHLAKDDKSRLQQPLANRVLPQGTTNGSNGRSMNGSGRHSNRNASQLPKASNENRKNHVDGDTRSPYHSIAPEGASLAALLAGVAENDNASLEQLRSSMVKRGLGSPRVDQRRDTRVDKAQRYQGRRVSEGMVKQNAIHKAQPRKTGSHEMQMQPAQHSSAATPYDNGNSLRPCSRAAAPSILTPETRQQSISATQAYPLKEHAYSGAGMSIMKTAAASSEGTSIQQSFKRSVGSAATDVASENAAKRRRIDDRASVDPEIAKSSIRVPMRVSGFVDRTDPDGERVSYSDEPELPGREPNHTNGASILQHPANVATPTRTVDGSSLDTALEAPVSTKVITPKDSTASRGRPASTQSAAVKHMARAIRPFAEKNVPYSDDDRKLLKTLKEVDGLPWDEILPYFPGRTIGSIQVHYSTKVGGRRLEAAIQVSQKPMRRSVTVTRTAPSGPASRNISPDTAAPVRKRRARGGGASAVDGFFSRTSIRGNGKDIKDEVEASAGRGVDAHPGHLLKQDRVHSNSASRTLRLRELGVAGKHAWERSPQQVSEELKNHVVKGHGLQQQYHGTSGDVVALSWSANDDRFVAGSIAISDATSMQYNMSRNLLIGDANAGELRELVDHHIPRPFVNDERNVNGLRAMRESQDPRLFLTVTAAGFSPDGDKLYTAGADKQLRMYATNRELSEVKCKYAIPHASTVDVLCIHARNAVATGCHSSSSSVNVYSCSDRSSIHSTAFSPSRRNLEVSVPIYPSALKWGQAHHHSNYLLAGFAGDEEKAHAGETCLWDVITGQSVDLRTATRNVFDLAWNPFPSPASVAFAVAAMSTGTTVSKGTRSVVHLFAPRQDYARRVQTLECPAHDLNDVIFCPHDDNLVAAGSADGTVYLWDQRASVDAPLHTLEHGRSVLVEDSPETGVRFLSWGATASRLYSGSSDGIVKVWNPYRSQDNANIEDFAAPEHQRAAVMSGAFNSDCRELLVGTENGRIDLFRIDGLTRAKPQQFKLHTAPARKQEPQEPLEAAHALLNTGEIELRPCGAMPFRQAVQGPNYSGPFLAPSAKESMQAEAAYQEALTTQHEASMKHATQAMYLNDDDDLLKVGKKVQEAQRTIDDLQERLEHFAFAQPKAEQFQRSLLNAQRARIALKASSHDTDPCHLDCNFLPGADELEDSLRSELRIPGKLHSIDLNAALTTNEEANDACAVCYPRNALNHDGVRIYCASCSLKRSNLTTTCSKCSAPARVETDKTRPTLCERCSFACFRCGQTAELNTSADGMNVVTCTSCSLVWEADILGYKLVSSDKGRSRRRSSAESLPDRIGRHWDRFADREREYYASLWEDKPMYDW